MHHAGLALQACVKLEGELQRDPGMFSLSLRGVQPEPRPDAATQISRASHSGSRYVFLPTLYLYVCVSHAFASVPCPQASSLWPPLECRVECISVFNAALYTFNLKWHWTASFDHGQDFELEACSRPYEIVSFHVLSKNLNSSR